MGMKQAFEMINSKFRSSTAYPATRDLLEMTQLIALRYFQEEMAGRIIFLFYRIRLGRRQIFPFLLIAYKPSTGMRAYVSYLEGRPSSHVD